MKYKAKQLQLGKFSVFTGKKYFTDFVFDTDKEAQQQALIMSHNFYQNQMNKAWSELQILSRPDDLTAEQIEEYGYPPEIKLIGNEHYTNQGDLMC